MKSWMFICILLPIAGCSRNEESVISASGTIEGTDVNISTEVPGRVRERRVDEGSRVGRGDTLLIIDDTEYQIQLRQASANEDAAEAQYRLTVEGPRKEDVAQAEIAFKNAEDDFKRMEGLLASHSVSQKQYDDARARVIAAQQAYLKLQTGSRREEIATARARREQAAAQVELLRKKIRDCHVLAPSAGVVTLKSIEPGEFVSVGASLLRITYLDNVKLTIYVSEPDLGRIRLGQHARITIDSKKNNTFDGVVTYISQIAEFTPKNVQTKEERAKMVFGVKLLIENPEGILKPGMPADAFMANE